MTVTTSLKGITPRSIDSAKVELLFRNPLKKDDQLSLDITLYDLPITKKWLRCLKDILRRQLHLEKNFLFHGYPETPRDLEYLCKEMNRHIAQVNKFSDQGGWENPYHISEVFTPENVVVDDDMNQDLSNRIHHHFELLQGRVWDISPYYTSADTETKCAIRHLNLLCHEMENLISSKAMVWRGLGDWICPSMILAFLDCPRYDLEDEDYEHFRLERIFGGVILHYCQVGKTWYETFCHQDEHVHDENISGTRYVSGEFNVNFGQTNPSVWKKKEPKFHDWLRSKGKDPNDKKLSLGWLHVGEIEREKNFGSIGIQEIHKLLGRYLDLYAIRVHDEKGIESCEYDYSPLDEDYERMQAQLMAPGMKVLDEQHRNA